MTRPIQHRCKGYDQGTQRRQPTGRSNGQHTTTANRTLDSGEWRVGQAGVAGANEGAGGADSRHAQTEETGRRSDSLDLRKERMVEETGLGSPYSMSCEADKGEGGLCVWEGYAHTFVQPSKQTELGI